MSDQNFSDNENLQQRIYVIYDSAAKAFFMPIYFANDDLAIRYCRNALSQANQISMSPEDFTLFHIGCFNVETAVIKPQKAHRVVCRFGQLAAQLNFDLQDSNGGASS